MFLELQIYQNKLVSSLLCLFAKRSFTGLIFLDYVDITWVQYVYVSVGWTSHLGSLRVYECIMYSEVFLCIGVIEIGFMQLMGDTCQV